MGRTVIPPTLPLSLMSPLPNADLAGDALGVGGDNVGDEDAVEALHSVEVATRGVPCRPHRPLPWLREGLTRPSGERQLEGLDSPPTPGGGGRSVSACRTEGLPPEWVIPRCKRLRAAK